MPKEDNQYIQKIRQKLSAVNSQIDGLKQQAIYLEGSKKTLEQLLEELKGEKE